jgi:hypothetical protein
MLMTSLMAQAARGDTRTSAIEPATVDSRAASDRRLAAGQIIRPHDDPLAILPGTIDVGLDSGAPSIRVDAGDPSHSSPVFTRAASSCSGLTGREPAGPDLLELRTALFHGHVLPPALIPSLLERTHVAFS